MPQSLVSLHVHMIFGTKNREPTLTEVVHPRLFEYIGGSLREQACRLTAAGGMPDHVHLLVSVNKVLSVSDTVRAIKANSSRWIRETFTFLRAFAWQAGYGAFSVSFSNLPKVVHYLENQA